MRARPAQDFSRYLSRFGHIRRWNRNEIVEGPKQRRSVFLTGLAAALAGVALPLRSCAAPERVLWLARPATGEALRAAFSIDGRHVYMPGYQRLCWLLRDVDVSPQAGFVPFSVATIEALWEIQQLLIGQGVDEPIRITSGYRTLETNSRIEGAARNSQHLRATAVDMYVQNVDMKRLFWDCYERAISGGIGYYEDHIHLDTGPQLSTRGNGVERTLDDDRRGPVVRNDDGSRRKQAAEFLCDHRRNRVSYVEDLLTDASCRRRERACRTDRQCYTGMRNDSLHHERPVRESHRRR